MTGVPADVSAQPIKPLGPGGTRQETAITVRAGNEISVTSGLAFAVPAGTMTANSRISWATPYRPYSPAVIDVASFGKRWTMSTTSETWSPGSNPNTTSCHTQPAGTRISGMNPNVPPAEPNANAGAPSMRTGLTVLLATTVSPAGTDRMTLPLVSTSSTCGKRSATTALVVSANDADTRRSE